MLPKIGDALVQFIPSIHSANKRNRANEKDRGSKEKQDFQRFRPRNPPKTEKEGAPERESHPPASISSPGPTASVTHAFVQLLALFQKRRNALMKWLGTKAYQTASRDQGKTGKIRKGAVIDDKAA